MVETHHDRFFSIIVAHGGTMILFALQAFIVLTLFFLLTSCASRPPQPVQPVSISTINIQQVPSNDPVLPLRRYNSAQENIDEAIGAFNQKSYRETLGFLEEAIKMNSGDFRAYALRGVTWSMLGEGSKARQDFLKTIEINPKSKEADTSRLWLEKLNNPLPVTVAPLSLNTNANLINNGKRTHQSGGRNERRTREELIQKQFADFSQRNYDPTLKSILDRSGFFQPVTLDKSNKFLAHELCRFSKNQDARIFIHSKRADLNLTEKPYPSSFVYRTVDGLQPLAEKAPPYFEGNTSYDIELIFDIDIYETKNCNTVNTFEKKMAAGNVSGKQVGSVVSHMLDVLFHQINLEIHDALL